MNFIKQKYISLTSLPLVVLSTAGFLLMVATTVVLPATTVAAETCEENPNQLGCGAGDAGDALGQAASEFCKSKGYNEGSAKFEACVTGHLTASCDGVADAVQEACQAGLTASPNTATRSGGNAKCKTNIINVGCDKDAVMKLLGLVLDIMTIGVGIAAVGGIAYGSLLYTTAGGSQDQVKKAIGIIQNVVIGLVAYVCLYAFLQFILPGGAF